MDETALMPHRGAGSIVVDHRNPICDDLCRCPTCKPPLVRAPSAGTQVALVAAVPSVIALGLLVALL